MVAAERLARELLFKNYLYFGLLKENSSFVKWKNSLIFKIYVQEIYLCLHLQILKRLCGFLLFHMISQQEFNKESLTLIFSPSISTVFIMKSTPIVAPCPGGNMPWVNLRTRQVLPTPALPTRTTLKRNL